MSLCRLLVLDFIAGIGRHDEHGNELYDARDLRFGLQLAIDYIADGRTVEPIDEFNLTDFKNWCEKQLDNLSSHV